MHSRLHLPEELRWRATGRLGTRQSQSKLARWLNVSPFVIHTLWQQFQPTDSAFRIFRQRRSTATTCADDRHFSLRAQRNRTAIPTQMIPCWIIERFVYARQAAISIPLTSRYRRECLRWAYQDVHRTQKSLEAVIFTDESRFSFQSDSILYLI